MKFKIVKLADSWIENERFCKQLYIIKNLETGRTGTWLTSVHCAKGDVKEVAKCKGIKWDKGI